MEITRVKVFINTILIERVIQYLRRKIIEATVTCAFEIMPITHVSVEFKSLRCNLHIHSFQITQALISDS